MATFALTIGGTAKSVREGSLEIRKTANVRGTARFDIFSTDGTYRPALDAEVIITIDGTRVFGGVVDRVTEKGVFDGGGRPAIVTTVNAFDFNHYIERRVVNGTVPAGTLKSKLQWAITNYLTVFGVTLDGAQVDGPSLPEQKFNYERLASVINEWLAMTADFGQPFQARIDDFKVLKAFQPSTVAAPFNLTADATQVMGDVEVETNRDHYANRVYVKVPAKSQEGRIESFAGNGVATTFTLQYTPTKLYGHILVQSGGGETLGPESDPGQWVYHPSTNTIERLAGPTTNGETYNLYFDGIFEGAATGEDASAVTSPWEKVVIVEEVPVETTAQAIADGEVASSLPLTKKVKYVTLTGGLLPGQSQTVTIPKRNLSTTVIVTDVVIRDYLTKEIRYEIAAVFDAQTNLSGRSWQDQYKTWRGDKLGGAASNVAAGAGGVASVGPSEPFESNQFNRSGKFGGNAAWLFKETETSVLLGTSHTVNGSADSAANLLVGEGHTVN